LTNEEAGFIADLFMVFKSYNNAFVLSDNAFVL